MVAMIAFKRRIYAIKQPWAFRFYLRWYKDGKIAAAYPQMEYDKGDLDLVVAGTETGIDDGRSWRK